MYPSAANQTVAMRPAKLVIPRNPRIVTALKPMAIGSAMREPRKTGTAEGLGNPAWSIRSRMAGMSFRPGSSRSPRACTSAVIFSARSCRRRLRIVSAAWGSAPSSSESLAPSALCLPGATSPRNSTAKVTERAMSARATARITRASDLDVHDLADPEISDDLHDGGDGHHQLAHRVGEQEPHVGRVQHVDDRAHDDREHRQRV